MARAGTAGLVVSAALPADGSPGSDDQGRNAVTEAWARARTSELADHTGAGHIPAYGSEQWLALPPDAPRRMAAVIEAAELWRRQQAEQARLEALAEQDPGAWYLEVTADADDQARRLARTLARAATAEETRGARIHRPPRQLRATPGWPPVAVPGRPGLFLRPEPRRHAA